MDVGPAELLLVLIVALVVFGPKKLPQLARGVGDAIREFRESAAERPPPAEVTDSARPRSPNDGSP